MIALLRSLLARWRRRRFTRLQADNQRAYTPRPDLPTLSIEQLLDDIYGSEQAGNGL